MGIELQVNNLEDVCNQLQADNAKLEQKIAFLETQMLMMLKSTYAIMDSLIKGAKSLENKKEEL